MVRKLNKDKGENMNTEHFKKIRLGNSMCARLKLLIVVATIIFSIPEISSADEWQKVFTDSSENQDIRAMSEFRGDLYVGKGVFGTSDNGANILGLVDIGCQDWSDVTPPWSANTGGETMSMSVFKDHLYVGTEWGQVFRTDDGSNWEDVTGNLPTSKIDDMAEFNGQLYVNGWRTSDDTKIPHIWENALSNVDGNVESLEVFKGRLYAGVGLDNDNGIEILRTEDGNAWTKFYELAGKGHVYALKTFKDYLYVGDYHGRGISRTDGLNWERIDNVIGSGDVFRLEEHKDKLYIGVKKYYEQLQYGLYSSEDGMTWTPIEGPFDRGVYSIVSYGGKLYIGTEEYNEDSGRHATIYQYGAPTPSCGVWTTELIYFPGSGGKYTSIALDSSENQYITYHANYPAENSLVYVERKPNIISVPGWVDNPPIWAPKFCGHCSDNTVDYSSTDIGEYTSIRLDSSGRQHISYYDRINGNLRYAKSPSDLEWIVDTVDSEGDVGQYTSIALDSSDYPHISYYNVTGGNLKYAKWDGNKWNIETVEKGSNEKPNKKDKKREDVGQYTSIALDSSDHPHISYYDSIKGDLKHADWDGNKWKIETVDSEGDVGRYTSIAIDFRDHVQISYHDNSNGDLKYARRSGDSWDTEVVESIDNVGAYTSIALASDFPRISYTKYDTEGTDIIPTDLKYARWVGDEWIIETVDSTGNVGAYTSLAYSDHAHISYYDNSHDVIRYATRIEEGDVRPIP